MITMKIFYFLTFMISLFTIISTSSITLNDELGKCLSDVVTQGLSVSYYYLQLSSKFGASNAYPGFSSLFTKLSDDDTSKAFDLVKFLILRKAQLDRLIHKDGIKTNHAVNSSFDVQQTLIDARHRNNNLWKEVVGCHRKADTLQDANLQDYLESHLIDHHIQIDKLLADIDNRLKHVQVTEKKLTIYMIDEELLETYGDRRKDIFS